MTATGGLVQRTTQTCFSRAHRPLGKSHPQLAALPEPEAVGSGANGPERPAEAYTPTGSGRLGRRGIKDDSQVSGSSYQEDGESLLQTGPGEREGRPRAGEAEPCGAQG